MYANFKKFGRFSKIGLRPFYIFLISMVICITQYFIKPCLLLFFIKILMVIMVIVPRLMC